MQYVKIDNFIICSLIRILYKGCPKLILYKECPKLILFKGCHLTKPLFQEEVGFIQYVHTTGVLDFGIYLADMFWTYTSILDDLRDR